MINIQKYFEIKNGAVNGTRTRKPSDWKSDILPIELPLHWGV